MDDDLDRLRDGHRAADRQERARLAVLYVAMAIPPLLVAAAVVWAALRCGR